jgi:hypothetical protein
MATPLSDALTAAQRSALAALEKAYVAGSLEADDFYAALNDCGITDQVDQSFLRASLDVLREWGVAAPTMTERVAASQQPAKASDSQVSYIIDLLKKGNHGPLAEQDLRALTAVRASTLIEALKDGTYKAEEWDVPF